MSAAGPLPSRATRFDPRLLAALGGLQLKARYVMEGFLSGIHKSPFHGLSVEFSEYRDYQPGDDPRRIDWRLYARSDRLCVKKYEQETNARVHLLCDTSASMNYRGDRASSTKLEYAAILAAGLAGLLLRQGDAVGVLWLRPDGQLGYLPPARSPRQFGMVLGVLERLQAEGGPRLPATLARAGRPLRRRGLVLVFTDLLEPAAHNEERLRRLRFDGHDCLVVQVLDPDELDFPFSDMVLEDLETGRRRHVGTGARARWQQRFEAFMGEHRDQLARLAIPHTVARTDEDPRQVLTRMLAIRPKR